MTYPPINPGYPMPQQGPPYGAPAAAAPTRLPAYLGVAVVALGLAAYLFSFGPLLRINTDMGPFGGAELTASGLSYWTIAALVAALLAAANLLPKSTPFTPVIAVAAVLGVLLVIGQILNRPAGVSAGWALWLVLACTMFQAAAAVTALLFETGVLAAPASRPRYEQYGQYGPPPGGYYGQPGPPQRPGYPSQYGGYPAGPSTGGFGSLDAAGGAPTPPTGFPSYAPGSSAQQPMSGPEIGQPSPVPEPPPGSAPDSTQP